jgi:hypothetical protein
MDLDQRGLLDIDTAPLTFTHSLMIDLLSATLICLRTLNKGDMRESSGKLGSRAYETLRFNLCGRKSIIGER